MDLQYRGLHKIDILDKNHILIGYILGIAIDWQKKEVLRADVIFTETKVVYESQPDCFEKELYMYSGSWLAILLIDGCDRIYMDANGSLGVVFSKNRNIAASGAIEIFNEKEYYAELDNELYNKLNVEGDGWFPSGLTAHKNISRLLANHYLDLSLWEPIRHWPNKDTNVQSKAAAPSNTINTVVEGTISALIKDSDSIAIALTAGNETRYLAAITQKLWHKVKFVTVNFPNTETDIHIAKRIAKEFNLSHQILPRIKNDLDNYNRWVCQSNHCVSGGNNSLYGESLSSLSNYGYFIGGLGGEVGRGFFYRKSDGNLTELSSVNLLHRMGLPATRKLVEHTDRWLHSIKHLSAEAILDLAYIELRMGPWAFGTSYVDYPCISIHPMINRYVYSAMINLSMAAKKDNFVKQLSIALMPELHKIPVNRFGDYRDMLKYIKRFNLRRVVSKFRKVFG